MSVTGAPRSPDPPAQRFGSSAEALSYVSWTMETGSDRDMNAGLAPRDLAWYSPGCLGTLEKPSAGAKRS
jgi:hypothetical protein